MAKPTKPATLSIIPQNMVSREGPKLIEGAPDMGAIDINWHMRLEKELVVVGDGDSFEEPCAVASEFVHQEASSAYTILRERAGQRIKGAGSISHHAYVGGGCR